MAMNIGVTNLATNLGVSFEFIIVFVVGLAFLAFFAKDFKLGAIMEFLINALIFIWFYEKNLNWVVPLVLMFMWFIVMAFTLYAVRKQASTYGGLV